MTRIFSFLSKCFSDWCKSVLVRRSKLIREKKNEKSRDNKHTCAISFIIVVIVFIL